MAKETLNFTFDLDELYILQDVVGRFAMSTSGWTKEHNDRIANMQKWFSDAVKQLEKPVREEQILTQAAAILRERGITSWNP